MSDVRPEIIRWFWDSRIPFSMVSMLEADPDMGKSTLLLDLAARYTTGRPMPTEAEETRSPGRVIIWAPEDPVAQVTRPRLDAAGADSSRIRRIKGVLELPDDAVPLGNLIKADGAGLVIIEPLTGALASRIDSYKDSDVRRALTPLADLAEQTGAAIVTVRHFRKGDGPAIHRGGGSIAFGALVRSLLVAGRHPTDEGVRVVARAKGNLTPTPPPSLRYRFISVGHVGRIEWLGECEISADELVRQQRPEDKEKRKALKDAEEVLREILANGPVLSTDVEEQAKAVGVALPTLKRAKRSLKVGAKQRGRRHWCHLPGQWEEPPDDQQ